MYGVTVQVTPNLTLRSKQTWWAVWVCCFVSRKCAQGTTCNNVDFTILAFKTLVGGGVMQFRTACDLIGIWVMCEMVPKHLFTMNSWNLKWP